MFGFIKRMIGRRHVEAGSSGSRWRKTGSMSNVNAAILAAATPSARRASYFAINNPWCARAIASLVSNTIGSGIVPRPRHPDADVRKALKALWNTWAAETGYYGQQALAVRQMVSSGEAFGLMGVAADDDRPDLVPLRLDLVDRDSMERAMDIGAGSRVRAGIERNAAGKIVAYHVLPANPSDPFVGATSYTPIRVPAEDVLHLFQPLAAGQLRGLTWLAPVLLRLSELDAFEDAALVRAKVKSLYCGFILDQDSDRRQDEPVSDDLVMAPGSLLRVPFGYDVKFSTPGESNTGEYRGFVKGHLRSIAAGIGPGIPYELVSGDLEGVTYSSIRQGMIEYRRGLSQLQDLTVIPAICAPVWRRFVTLAVLTGRLQAPDFGTNAAAYLAVEWAPEGWSWIDPEAEIKAEVLAINNKLQSRTQSIASRGYDADEVDAEIAADRFPPTPAVGGSNV